MRIAHFHNLPFGGALRSTRNQLSRLRGRHEIDCFSLSSSADGGRALEDCCANNKIYDFELTATRSSNSLTPLAWINDFKRMSALHKRIAQDIDKGGYDLCITRTCPFFEVPTIHDYLATPTVYFSHSTRYPAEPFGARERRTRNPFAARLKRILFESNSASIFNADCVVTNSWFSREDLYRLYGVNSMVSHVGVNLADFYPMPEIERKNIALGVGALAPFKAHGFSVEAVATIPEDIRPELWIAHHTETHGEKQRVQDLADSLGVRLRFITGAGTDEIRELYNTARLTLFPSIFEPLGLVPLESMACGTPVVGVAEGGIRETVVDGITGALTQRDPAAFGGEIARILLDSEMWGAMSAASIDIVRKKWDWDNLALELEAILERVARKRGGEI